MASRETHMALTEATRAASRGRTWDLRSNGLVLAATALLLVLSFSAPGAMARPSPALSGPASRWAVTTPDGTEQAVTKRRGLQASHGKETGRSGKGIKHRSLDDDGGFSGGGGGDSDGVVTASNATVSGNCSVTFGGATLRYASCVTLDSAGGSSLHGIKPRTTPSRPGSTVHPRWPAPGPGGASPLWEEWQGLTLSWDTPTLQVQRPRKQDCSTSGAGLLPPSVLDQSSGSLTAYPGSLKSGVPLLRGCADAGRRDSVAGCRRCAPHCHLGRGPERRKLRPGCPGEPHILKGPRVR